MSKTVHVCVCARVLLLLIQLNVLFNLPIFPQISPGYVGFPDALKQVFDFL